MRPFLKGSVGSVLCELLCVCSSEFFGIHGVYTQRAREREEERKVEEKGRIGETCRDSEIIRRNRGFFFILLFFGELTALVEDEGSKHPRLLCCANASTENFLIDICDGEWYT